MPPEEHSGHTNDSSAGEWRHTRALQHLGPDHSSQDCHELLLRLKAQVQCLEEILAEIRSEIDMLECDETIDQVRETLEAEI